MSQVGKMSSEEFMSNVDLPIQVLGNAVLTHELQNQSSSRVRMTLNADSQIEVVTGCECGRILTGYESKFGKYEFDECERDQDVQVMKVIPKFSLSMGNGIMENPSYTVIYIGESDNKIGFFTISNYKEVHAGFGYRNKKVTSAIPVEGDWIPKDQKFNTAPNHDGPIYNLGMNVATCFMPMWDTAMDAFIISRSLAERMTHKVVDSVAVNIGIDDRPLNLYGNETDYRCFPNVGETVRDDGYLLGLRNMGENFFLTDFTPNAMATPRQNHDFLVQIEPGATIVDVQVFVNPARIKKLNKLCYAQLMDYHSLHNRYYESVIAAYEELSAAGYECSPAFTNLVSRCLMFSYRHAGRVMTPIDKKDPIENVRVEITYAYDQKVSLGYKLSGSEGSKGVVAAIWEDEDMPVSIHGKRADLIVEAESPFNRLNSGQFHEQFATLAMDIITDRVRTNQIPPEQQYDYLVEFLDLLQPMWGKLVREKTSSAKSRAEFLEAVKQDGLYVVLPPYCNSLNPDTVLKIAEKYHIDRGPLTYYRRNPDGSREKVVTKFDGLIGDKYMYLLGKRPPDAWSAVEFAYVNQILSPMKPKSKAIKMQCQHKQTPQKDGEDELANLTAIIGPMATSRLTGVCSNSTVALNNLATCLLRDPHPSALKNIGMSTKEILDTSVNIGLCKHFLASIGYEIVKL